MNKTSLYFCLPLFCLFSYAVNAVSISGKVTLEDHSSQSQCQIEFQDKTYQCNKSGEFLLSANKQAIYTFTVKAKGFYPSIQTFSHFELSESMASGANAKNDQLLIPTITLVAKTSGRVMFAFGGDAMMGRRYYKPYFGDSVLIHDESRLEDSKSIVENVKAYLSIADIASVNLETQVFTNKPGDAAPKSVSFFSKPEILDALEWAGVDQVTLGNNHTYDYKLSGLEETLKHLMNTDLGFSGAGINQEEALKAYVTQINGVNLGMLGYVGWEGRAKPNQVAEKDKGGAAFGSLENIYSSVTEQVKANRLPIVQYHGGYEYSNNPSGVTERRLKAAIDNGAAMAIAHHPHVTQGIELYKGKLIAYSMGNFIFDQYIPSTPYSFMLYVWMDGQKFHRAEIVPLYLKGYKPTPATGINRYTTMKRLTSLSSQRNTKISQSGGHGVISSKSILSQPQQVTVSFPQKAKTAPLYLLPWQKDLVKINPPKNVAYRLGTNLMNASDFESFSTFNSDERSWFFDRENTVLNSYGASGSRSLGVTIKKGKTSEIGLQAFRRKFKGDAPTTITAKFKTTQPAKVNFYWQGRRFKQKFFQARKESKKYLIGSVDLKPKTTWQKVELDFNSVRYNYPSNGFRAYRVMAEIELANGQTGKVDIDDFAVIEWQSAFSESETPIHINLESSQASFIGINKPTNQKVNLTLQ